MTLPTPRYVVRSVTGYEITPNASTGNDRGAPTSYYVLDRWYDWHVVAAFDAPKGRTSKHRRELAEARCAELNAEAT